MTIGKGDSFLILTRPESKLDKSIFTLKGKVLYVSLNKPPSSINTGKNYYFISAVKEKNYPFIESIQSLTRLSLLITSEVESKKYNYLIIDSVDTLLIYNDEDTTLRFLHFLINKMRVLGVKTVLLLLSDRKTIANQLGQIVSKTLRAAL